MKKVSQLALAGLLCLAPCALAQNADQNTAGPSRNQLKLRLTEPRDGAQISGSTIRVAVDYNKTIFGEGQGTKFGEKNFPMAVFDVYVDNALKQTLRGEGNVAVINDIPAGKHKIVVMAKNISNEVIDRAEVNVVNSEATAAASTSTDTTATSDANRGASTSSNTTDTTSRSYDTGNQTDTSSRGSSMPHTASNAPEAALAGLALVATGLLVARRAR